MPRLLIYWTQWGVFECAEQPLYMYNIHKHI